MDYHAASLVIVVSAVLVLSNGHTQRDAELDSNNNNNNNNKFPADRSGNTGCHQ